MNIKRYLLASLGAFVTFQLLDFVIHSVILMKTYQELSSLWRQDMMSYMWVMYLASAIMTLLFVYIYTKGYEGKGAMEGFRFGLIIGLFMQVPGVFGQYTVYPIPFNLALQWFFYGLVEFILAGIVVSLIYKPKE